ncbi:MAG: peptidylprolyl isomerase [Microthrixaceae bacterium]
MGTSSDKHTRQKANREAGEALRKQHEANTRRQKIGVGIAAAFLCFAVVVLIVALTGGKDESAAKKPAASSTTAPTTQTTAAAPAAELPTPPPGKTLTEPTECPPTDGAAERVQKFAGEPPTCINDARATRRPSTPPRAHSPRPRCQKAPIAVNNFVVLSRFRFYDGVPFHRIITGFVIQGGDGDGPPWGNNDLGYSFKDELPDSSDAYTDYSLAMANSGANTNGSQFFVVLPGGSSLQPLYPDSVR